MTTDVHLEALVDAARDGDRRALEDLVRTVQPEVLRLAVRFFGIPADAEEAAQEALVLLVIKLDRFDGRSSFRTWMYRVASNKFLSMLRSTAEQRAVSIEEFKHALGVAPSLGPSAPESSAESVLLLEEVKISCTLAMLLCLDRPHRIAYIFGEIMQLDHTTAAEILDVRPGTYRKRLQRARAAITELMRARCGVFDSLNPCRCARQLPCAIERGHVVPTDLVFASSSEQARRFPDVLSKIRRLDEARRAAALYRSHPDLVPKRDLASVVSVAFGPADEASPASTVGPSSAS